jgi:tRNA-dihydrouridine synthase B
MRTGWRAGQRNAVQLARAAESAGVAMITVHGRTREQGYKGEAEYETIAEVKSRLRIPVVANGDIDSPSKAAEVLARTGADAIMIGRAAQGRPWIFGDIAHFLATGQERPQPEVRQAKRWLIEHLHDHYALYGEFAGVRSARKHIGWALRALPGGASFRAHMNTLDDCQAQVDALGRWFDTLGQTHERLPAPLATAQEHDDNEAMLEAA